MAASWKRIGIAHLALALLVLVVPEANLAMTAPTISVEEIYYVGGNERNNADGSDSGGAGYAGIIAEMERTPDLLVYRIALQTNGGEVIATSRATRAVLLAYNGDGGIAVVYPDLGEPYRGVFSRIIEGVESQTKTHVTGIPVGANQNVQELASECVGRVFMSLSRSAATG